jgi:tetratricopeptide (TPR) repeat protein
MLTSPILVCGLVWLGTPNLRAQYAVSYGTFETEKSAREKARALQDAGVADACVAGQEVVGGPYAAFVDALVLCNGARSLGLCNSPAVKSVAETGSHRSCPFPAAFSFFNAKTKPLPQSGSIFRGGHDTLPREVAAAEFSRHKDHETSRGAALLSLADHEVRDKRRAEALQHQLAVARGTVASTHHIRIKACWDAARSLHALGRRLEAYQAYTELVCVVEQPVDRAACEVQRVGLLMELALSAKGNMTDVRSAARSALEIIPPDQGDTMKKMRSTVSLIAAESFPKENRFEEGIAPLEQFLADWKDFAPARREVIAGKLWLGVCYSKTGRTQGAIDLYEELLRSPIQEKDKFRNEEPYAVAGNRLVDLYRKSGNMEGMKAWVAYLRERHPERPETSKAVGLLEEYDKKAGGMR